MGIPIPIESLRGIHPQAVDPLFSPISCGGNVTAVFQNMDQGCFAAPWAELQLGVLYAAAVVPAEPMQRAEAFEFLVYPSVYILATLAQDALAITAVLFK